jgi:hypothetical protein
MIRLFRVIALSFILISCSTAYKPANSSAFQNRRPDISKVIYEGGNGKSIDNCIIIKNAGNETNGVASEYAYVSKIHGQMHTNWELITQSLQTNNNREYDVLNIQTLPQKEKISYYFDITDFYGKF